MHIQETAQGGMTYAQKVAQTAEVNTNLSEKEIIDFLKAAEIIQQQTVENKNTSTTNPESPNKTISSENEPNWTKYLSPMKGHMPIFIKDKQKEGRLLETNRFFPLIEEEEEEESQSDQLGTIPELMDDLIGLKPFSSTPNTPNKKKKT